MTSSGRPFKGMAAGGDGGASAASLHVVADCLIDGSSPELVFRQLLASAAGRVGATFASLLLSVDGAQRRYPFGALPRGLLHLLERERLFDGGDDDPARFFAPSTLNAPETANLSQRVLAAAEAVSLVIVPLRHGREVKSSVLFGSRRADLTEHGGVRTIESLVQEITPAVALARSFSRLARLESEHRAILDASGIATIVTSTDGQVVSANRRACDLLGMDARALVGRDLLAFVAHADRAPLSAAITRLQAQKPAHTVTVTMTGDRSSAMFALSGSLVEREGDASLLFLMAPAGSSARRNATDDRLAKVGELAAAVAHEINNPAGFVLGNLEYVRKRIETPNHGSVDGEIRHAISDAIAGAERIRDIAQVFRTSGRQPTSVESSLTVSELIDLSSRIALFGFGPKVDIVRRVPSTLSRIAGDKGRLQQVFTNLFVNAAQAVSPGTACEIVVDARDEDDGVAIRVSDNGPGIAIDVLPRIFEPYFTTKAPNVGLGLGLSLCRDIVQEHGGTLTVESTSSTGTTFRVWLPTKPRDEHRARRPGVLVVDGEPHMLRALTTALADGFDVRAATCGAAALALLEQSPEVEVVVAHAPLPDLDLNAFYDEVVARCRELARRVVFIQDAVPDEGRATCGDAMKLYKPFPRTALIDAVQRSLQHRGNNARS